MLFPIVIALAVLALIIYAIYRFGLGGSLVPAKPGVKPAVAKALATKIDQLAERKDIAIQKPKGIAIELAAKGFSAYINFDNKRHVVRYYEDTCTEQYATIKRSIRSIVIARGWGFQQHWFKAGLHYS